MRVKRILLLLSVLAVAVSLPAITAAQPAVELYYDDDDCDGYYLLVDGNEPAAYAVEFTPPSIPWILTAIRLRYDPRAPEHEVLRIEIWDPDRRTYFTYAVNISKYYPHGWAYGWRIIDVPDVMINITPFYVVVWLEKWGSVDWSEPGVGYDSDRPQGKSYRAGVVGGNVLRHKLKSNVMIRVIGTSPEAYAGEPLTPTVLGNIREELSSVARKVDSLEGRVDSLGKSLSDAKGLITSLASKLENLERGVAALESRLRDVEAIGKQLSELSFMLQLLMFALALLGVLTLVSLVAAARASKKAAKLEGQLKLLVAGSREMETPAPHPLTAQAEVKLVRAEARPPAASGWLIVIDGSNVAYAARDSSGRPRAKNITLAIKWAEERGYTPLVVVDASLKHHIDNPAMIDYLRTRGTLYEAPARTSADAFIIGIAEKHGALILSNDTFKEFLSEKPWIEKRRLAFMIVGDEIFVVPPGERSEGKAQTS